MKTASISMALLIFVISGCAVAQDPPGRQVDATAAVLPLRLDEVVALTRQGMTDDLVIAEIEQRGAAFVLAPRDFEQLRSTGLSEGLLRYLQGRASAESRLRAYLLAGRYRVPAYSGLSHLGYPYLGYYDGLHSYGGFERGHYGGRHFGPHRRSHLSGHHHRGHH